MMVANDDEEVIVRLAGAEQCHGCNVWTFTRGCPYTQELYDENDESPCCEECQPEHAADV